MTHPKSYLHAIIKFKNGLTKFLIHEPDMKIPIYNSIYHKADLSLKNNSLDFKTLNNLNLKKVDENKFPLVRLINKLQKIHHYLSSLNSINDYLVMNF